MTSNAFAKRYESQTKIVNTRSKDEERAEIEAQLEAFLNAGGVVNKVASVFDSVERKSFGAHGNENSVNAG